MPQQKFYKHLYFQVLVGIALGVMFGIIDPGRATAMKPAFDSGPTRYASPVLAL